MSTEQTDHHSRLQQAIALARESVQTGGGPFGAVIYCGDQQIATACNRVIPHSDPTAHAEIMALRQAGAHLGSPHLTDCILYASCQPCPMCLAAALWARVTCVIYAAPHTEARRAGFDDSAFATQLYGQAEPASLPSGFLIRRDIPTAAVPFDDWLASEGRVAY